MAIMIPSTREETDFNGSGGELQLYNLLEKLPDDYYIFHSTSWNERRKVSDYSRRTYVQWGEADFIVFHPELGIIFFEVKDGIISYTRERGWTQMNRITGEYKIIDPMAQAEKSKYYFLDILRARFGENIPYTLCSAVWFTYGDRNMVEGSYPNNYKEETVLWANDLMDITSAEKAIRKVYAYHSAKKVVPTEELTQKILDILSPEFGVFQSIRTRGMANRALFHQMTIEQSTLLDYLDEQDEAAIHGVAGTGKTVLAVQKAERLAETDKVLFLCFNRFLRQHLEEKKSTGNPNLSFYTLDGLYTKFTHGNVYDMTPEERNNAILEFLMEWENYDWKYKHIVVDEGQDFNNDHLLALHDIAKAQNGAFYVFYDKNQFIQGLEYPEWLDQMECRLVLSRNCRNTKEIAITSTRPIGIAEEKIKMKRENSAEKYETPPKPNLFFVVDKDELKSYIVKLLQKYTRAGYKKDQIVILSMKSEGNSILKKEDYRLSSTYRLTEDKKDDGILFTTVRKFKGLEADVIICIDIDTDTFTIEKQRSVFYVGTSRATTFLDLITTNTVEEIAQAISQSEVELKRIAAVKAIRNELKVKIATVSDLSE